jgi:hypothetical protein
MILDNPYNLLLTDVTDSEAEDDAAAADVLASLNITSSTPNVNSPPSTPLVSTKPPRRTSRIRTRATRFANSALAAEQPDHPSIASVLDFVENRSNVPPVYATPCNRAAAAGMTNYFASDSSQRPLTYRSAKAGPDKDLWTAEESHELLRLLEPSSRMPPTLVFIDSRTKPRSRLASYYNPQVKVKMKAGALVRRVRGTYGGDLSDYVGETAAYTSDLQTFKILLNATVSEDASLMTADIKDFYLGSALTKPEYMWIHRSMIPPDIQQKFSASIVWHKDRAMVRVDNSIYGLPQAGRIAQLKLTDLLSRNGYRQAANTPCLFIHESRRIAFTLVVDDFAVKYAAREDVDHLLSVIRQLYDVTADWTGSRYLGLHLTFDKANRSVTTSMPNYVTSGLRRFGVTRNSKPTHSPLPYVAPNYGSKSPQSDSPDTSAPVHSLERKKRIQQIIGYFLYYSRALDSTMLCTLSKLASRQSAPTLGLEADVEHFLQYAATWPEVAVTFHSSDMRLLIHSDASHLSEANSRGRVGGYHYLSLHGDATTAPTNGAIDVISSIIPCVTAAASESEYAALFYNCQAAISSLNTLHDLGYPQSNTPVFADNTTACGLANRTAKLRRSKAVDMRFHWIQDRVAQGQFKVIWRPGSSNLADFFTKTHPAKHFREHRTLYVNSPSSDTMTERVC